METLQIKRLKKLQVDEEAEKQTTQTNSETNSDSSQNIQPPPRQKVQKSQEEIDKKIQAQKTKSLCNSYSKDQVCVSCKVGSILIDNNCVSNCYTFQPDSTTVCDSCKPGYIMTKNSVCIAYQPECLEYKDGEVNCGKCSDRTFLATLNEHSFCIPKIQYCEDQMNYKCIKCQKGYVKDPNERKCCAQKFIRHCLEQIDNTCIKCQPGFKWIEASGVCEAQIRAHTWPKCKEDEILIPPNLCLKHVVPLVLPIEEPVFVPNCIDYNTDGKCILCEGEDIFQKAKSLGKDCVCKFSEDKEVCQPEGKDNQLYFSLQKTTNTNKCYPRIQYCEVQVNNVCSKCCDGLNWNVETQSCCKLDSERRKTLL